MVQPAFYEKTKQKQKNPEIRIIQKCKPNRYTKVVSNDSLVKQIAFDQLAT